MLVVDNFLVHCTDPKAFTHLVETLQKYYTITVDNGATKVCGLPIDCNYIDNHVMLSTPGYIEKALAIYQSGPFPAHN